MDIERQIEHARSLAHHPNRKPAITLLRRILAADPDHATAHVLLSSCLERDDDPTGAMAHAERALEIAPEWSTANARLGWCHFERSEFARARALAHDAIRLDPMSRDGFELLVSLQIDAHEFVDAEQSISEMLRLDPQDEWAIERLGFTRLKLGRLEEAESAFRESLRLHAENPYAHRGLAELALARRDRSGALSHARSAASVSPSTPIDDIDSAAVMGELHRAWQWLLWERRFATLDRSVVILIVSLLVASVAIASGFYHRGWSGLILLPLLIHAALLPLLLCERLLPVGRRARLAVWLAAVVLAATMWIFLDGPARPLALFFWLVVPIVPAILDLQHVEGIVRTGGELDEERRRHIHQRFGDVLQHLEHGRLERARVRLRSERDAGAPDRLIAPLEEVARDPESSILLADACKGDTGDPEVVIAQTEFWAVAPDWMIGSRRISQTQVAILPVVGLGDALSGGSVSSLIRGALVMLATLALLRARRPGIATTTRLALAGIAGLVTVVAYGSLLWRWALRLTGS